MDILTEREEVNLKSDLCSRWVVPRECIDGSLSLTATDVKLVLLDQHTKSTSTDKITAGSESLVMSDEWSHDTRNDCEEDILHVLGHCRHMLISSLYIPSTACSGLVSRLINIFLDRCADCTV